MAIVSLSEFNKYTGVQGDSLAQNYIDSAVDVVTNYLGYSPEQTSYTEEIDGNGADCISLQANNITSVTKVKVNGNEVPVIDFYTKNNWLYYRCGWFDCGKQNIHVEYTAGWTSSAMPKIIKQTVMQIAALLQVESGQNIGVSSKSFADSGTRTFLSTRKYDDYLLHISKYKAI